MDIFITDKQNELAKSIFVNSLTRKEIDLKLYPLNKKEIKYYEDKRHKERKPRRFIAETIKEWDNKGYLESKNSSINEVVRKGYKTFSRNDERHKSYKLNLKPFFEYANSKFKKRNLNIELNSIDQEIINYIFQSKEVRNLCIKIDNKSLNECIRETLSLTLDRTFIIGFLIENKKHIKKPKSLKYQILNKYSLREFYGNFMIQANQLIESLIHKINKLYDKQNLEINKIYTEPKYKLYHTIPFNEELLEKRPDKISEDDVLKEFSKIFFNKANSLNE